MKFTVDRKKWLRGVGFEESRLLTGDGQRCCFGFVCQQLGMEDDSIMRHLTVGSISFSQRNRRLMDFAFSGNTEEHDWIWSAYKINDNRSIGDPERESKLVTIFSANGHEIEFVN